MGNNTGSGIRLRQLFDVGEHDCEIHFDWAGFLDALKDDIRVLAVNRCHRMLLWREGQADMLDRDCLPPSPPRSE